MAKAITIELVGDAARLSRTLDTADHDVRRFGDRMDDAGRRLGGAFADADRRVGASIASMVSGLGVTLVSAAGAAGVAAGAALIGGLVAASNRATELQAIGRRVETVFAEAMPQVLQFSDMINERLGVSTRTVMGMTAAVGDLLVPMGFTRVAAADMSQRVVELGGALRNWTGNTRSAQEINEILTSAILGETQALESLGIAISAADIQAELAARGQQDLTGAAMEQAAALVILDLAYGRSTDALTAWQTQQGGMGASIDRIRSLFGDLTDTLALRLAPHLQAFADWIGARMPDIQSAVVGAFDSMVAFVRDRLLPTFDNIRDWWTGPDGQAFRDAVSTFFQSFRADMAGAEIQTSSFYDTMASVTRVIEGFNRISVQFNGAMQAMEDGGFRFREMWTGMWDNFVARTIGGIRGVLDGFLNAIAGMLDAGARFVGAFNPQMGASMARAAEDVRGFRDRANEALNQVQRSLSITADTAPARRSIDELMASYRNREIALSVNARGLYGDGLGLEMTGGGGPPLRQAAGYQAQMNALRTAFPGLPLTSGFRKNAITATGNPSYHGMGRAVDVPPSMAVFNWIRQNYGAITKELIFSPAGTRQIHNGQPHMYTGVTRSNHFDHVHWALEQGGTVLQPGRFLVGEQGPEIVNLGRGSMVAPLSPHDPMGDVVYEIRLLRGALESRIGMDYAFHYRKSSSELDLIANGMGTLVRLGARGSNLTVYEDLSSKAGGFGSR